MSIKTKIMSADTRDVMSLIITVLLVVGSLLSIFDPKEVMIIIAMVFAFWFAKSNGNNSNSIS